MQGEFALCQDEDVLVGSYAATTCCIVAVAVKSAKMVALAHIDESIVQAPQWLDQLLNPLAAHQADQER
jgi:Protein N-terminal asparagine amidohydrolase